MSKQTETTPYSEEQLTKIGKLTCTIDLRIKNLKEQIKGHEANTEEIKGIKFSNETVVAFKMFVGIDLSNVEESAKQGIEALNNELNRLEDVRERILENEETLLACSEFFDLIYQPSNQPKKG